MSTKRKTSWSHENDKIGIFGNLQEFRMTIETDELHLKKEDETIEVTDFIV